jgi:hypothetical protein
LRKADFNKREELLPCGPATKSYYALMETTPQDRFATTFEPPFSFQIRCGLASAVKCVMLAGFLFFQGQQSAWPQLYDAARDFSIVKNPNGVWSYGYKKTLADTFTLFDEVSLRGGELGFWISSAHFFGNEPSVAKNFLDFPKKPCTDCDYVLAPGQMVIHPGHSGEYCIVRWTCPASGFYDAAASFFGLGSLSRVSVHVFADGEQISGALFTATGQSTNFSNEVFVPSGGVLDAAVGFSTDDNFGDATGLQFWISPVVPGGQAATAVARIVNGFLVDVAVTDGGSGYVDAPEIHFLGGGTGATAQATVENGKVVSIKVISAGSGYNDTTQVVVEPPPKLASLSIRVQTVRVTLSVNTGRHYLLESSVDLKNWTTVSDFVADANFFTRDFDVFETGRFFRISEVPR